MVAATDVTLNWTNEQKVLRRQERRFKVMTWKPPHSQPVPFSEPMGLPSPQAEAGGVAGVWVLCRDLAGDWALCWSSAFHRGSALSWA